LKFKPASLLHIFVPVFLGTGIFYIFLCGILLANHISFIQSNPSAHAVIKDIYRSTGSKSSNIHVYVSYEVGENEYFNELGYYSSSMHKGDIIKIYYSSDDPEIIMEDTYIGDIIPGIAGLAFASVGTGMLVFSLKKKKRIKDLLENGICVEAEITEIFTDYKTRINKIHPDYITCQVTNPVTGITTTYKSEKTLSDLVPFIGKKVKIYINPSNPKDAYVDIRSLIENSVEEEVYAGLEYR